MAGSVELAHKASERHAWREAYDAYAEADELELTPVDLERFADSAWWTGKLDKAIGLRERSYAGFSAAGDKLGAGRLALTLSWDHMNRGAFAVSRGWFANAERLLDGLPESAGARPPRALAGNRHPPRGRGHGTRAPGARAGLRHRGARG